MILPIYIYGSGVLREKAAEVDLNNTEGLPELIDNMYQTMRESDGVGIAAPQVGKSLRLLSWSHYQISHQDVGQMDMYIRMYDELKRSEGDNPTIGIILCSDTDEDIARYSVMHGNEQLFASKYKLYLPTEEELKAEIETQKAMFYLQQQENKI